MKLPQHQCVPEPRGSVCYRFRAMALVPAMCWLLVAGIVVACSGCSDDRAAVRAIREQRQRRLQNSSVQNHLAEMHKLLEKFIELNPKEARRQISYHLNSWAQEQGLTEPSENKSIPELVKSIDDLLTNEQIEKRIGQMDFNAKDTDHLRDAYLSRQLIQWVDRPVFDDPLLADWFDSLPNEIGAEDTAKLQTASRLFDWCVRNISYEPQDMPLPYEGIEMPFLFKDIAFSEEAKVTFQGAGYRQTSYQTLYRGTGDAWQLASVFSLLCRQVRLETFFLAVADEDSGERKPWSVGVLIGGRIYLFEPELGIPIPGPGQEGIATLAEARSDASVMRRLNVAGFFDYPLSKSDVSQSIALICVVPEAISSRMKRLQGGLTGQYRLVTHVDVDELASRIDAVRGIADVRLSELPLLAERYEYELERAADRIPGLQFWYRSRWAIIESPIDSSKQLALGRWRHLQGEFSDIEEDGFRGARPLYLTQRAPEFEIAKLRTDVDLQKTYGIRRELGMDSKLYEQLVVKAQGLMRSGKRTAAYWIGLLQYDDGRYQTAQSWLTKRVIEDGQESRWDGTAVYNAGRTAEKLNDYDAAIEFYKSDANGRPHGSRVRARLLAKQQGK